MVDTLLTDGAEQEAGEPAMSTGPDHQEVTRGGGAYQDRGRSTLDDLPLDLDVRRFPTASPSAVSSVSLPLVQDHRLGVRRVQRTDGADVAITPWIAPA